MIHPTSIFPPHLQLLKQEDGPLSSAPFLSPALPSTSTIDAFSNAASAHALAPAPQPQAVLRPSSGSLISQGPYQTTRSFASPPMAVCSGPMSDSIALPARPKPGRKAATDEPENKRKAQNRQAQRAFRDRKTQQAVNLEHDNAKLKRDNEFLCSQLQQLQEQLAQNQTPLNELQQDLAEAQKRASEERDKWQGLLATMAKFQKASQDALSQAMEATTKVQELEHELRRATGEIHRLNSVSQIVSGSAGSTVVHYQPQMPLQPVVSSRVSQKRPLPTDGCGNCEENGACPCVDSYVDGEPQSFVNDAKPSISRIPSNASMSINALLSPESSANVPELIADNSSPEELETDFTSLYHSQQSTARAKDDPCGFCKNDGLCLCSADMDANAAKMVVEMGPPAVRPGSCLECQTNPEQKAYCESLARERQVSREISEGQPDPKRARLQSSDVAIPCASAFSLYKRFSQSGEPPSYDEMYKEYVKSNPTSRQGTAVFTNGSDSQRKFSAFETDIATVIANLRHRGSNSSSNNGTDSGSTSSGIFSTNEQRG